MLKLRIEPHTEGGGVIQVVLGGKGLSFRPYPGLGLRECARELAEAFAELAPEREKRAKIAETLTPLIAKGLEAEDVALNLPSNCACP